MAKNDLFTIILSNYNQEKYIYEAIDSVLKQKYTNIELIITDDASTAFDKAKIKKYINNKSNNISKLEFIENDKNIGTVKTMNKALEKACGSYIFIFAADDVLYDENVITKFYKHFKDNSDSMCVSSVCTLCDSELNDSNNLFPNNQIIKTFNGLSAKKQNVLLREGPVFAPGCTAYRKELFEELNYFDETYKLIEDWSWFLRLTRMGNKVHIMDSISLLHRGGGVSESFKISNSLIEDILKDTYNIYNNEVFNGFSKINLNNKLNILKRYKLFIKMYDRINMKFTIKYYNMIVKNKDVLIHKLRFLTYKIYTLIFLILSVILSIIFKNIINFSNYYLILFVPILFYTMNYLFRRVKR